MQYVTFGVNVAHAQRYLRSMLVRTILTSQVSLLHRLDSCPIIEETVRSGEVVLYNSLMNDILIT